MNAPLLTRLTNAVTAIQNMFGNEMVHATTENANVVGIEMKHMATAKEHCSAIW